ncbi:hypothetical protein MPSEU_000399900 [Mayamaea pseudoterrestris]|nr:hypothetical protein MPSEU_000399900 [Mayamaea pseudoterrestris]
MTETMNGTPLNNKDSSASDMPGGDAAAPSLFSPRSLAAATLSSFSQSVLSGSAEKSEPDESAAAFFAHNEHHFSVDFNGDFGLSLTAEDDQQHPHQREEEVDEFAVPQERRPSGAELAASFTIARPSIDPSSNGPLKQTHPADHSLVTPTPSKKPRSAVVNGMSAPNVAADGSVADATAASSSEAVYDRKRKSLGALAVVITDHLSKQPAGTVILVDELAKSLEVERRRIYDVINILESVYMVTKHAKNTYVWLTSEHLPQMLALLQQEALLTHPYDAARNGLKIPKTKRVPEQASSTTAAGSTTDAKSLSRLSQQFLQVFLVGNEAVSLADASDKITGRTWTQHELAALVCKTITLPEDAKQLASLAYKGLKTKIRRLYDVGNVLAALGILTKLDDKYWARNSNAATRPMYSWSYHLSPHALLTDVYVNMPDGLKGLQIPFIDGRGLTSFVLKAAADGQLLPDEASEE